ncbi:MAG: hypothetical protein V2B14_03555 [bacterium]
MKKIFFLFLIIVIYFLFEAKLSSNFCFATEFYTQNFKVFIPEFVIPKSGESTLEKSSEIIEVPKISEEKENKEIKENKIKKVQKDFSLSKSSVTPKNKIKKNKISFFTKIKKFIFY